MSITLEAAKETDLETLREMVGWYTVDLAKFYPPGVRPPVMVADEWLRRATPNVFMVHCGKQVAGFIVVAIRPCIPGVSGNYVSEYYIKPEFRHSKVALLSGGLLMRLLPGEWAADVLALNDLSMRWTRAMTRRYGTCLRERSIYTEFGEARRFRWKVV